MSAATAKSSASPKRTPRKTAVTRTPTRAIGTDRIPADQPRIYADQAMDVVYGLHTTKIVLGEETGGGNTRAVATVVIPTATLLLLAKGIVSDLTSAGMVKETAERFAEILSAMQNSRVA